MLLRHGSGAISKSYRQMGTSKSLLRMACAIRCALTGREGHVPNAGSNIEGLGSCRAVAGKVDSRRRKLRDVFGPVEFPIGKVGRDAGTLVCKENLTQQT